MEQHSSGIKDLHRRLQPYASTPEGPVDRKVQRAAAQITVPSNASNMIGWKAREGSEAVVSKHS